MAAHLSMSMARSSSSGRGARGPMPSAWKKDVFHLRTFRRHAENRPGGSEKEPALATGQPAKMPSMARGQILRRGRRI